MIEGDYHEMLPEDFSDILTIGGTILGTSRQPFKEMRKTIEDSEETKLDKMLHTVKRQALTVWSFWAATARTRPQTC